MTPSSTPASAAPTDTITPAILPRDDEALLRGAFDDAPIGMAVSSIDGRWVRANRAFCDILGYAEEEFQAMTFVDITHPDDVERSTELQRALVAGDCTRYQCDKRYMHRDGRTVWVSVTVSSLRTIAGQPQYLLGHILDITERVLANDALRESNLILRTTQEIANVGSWSCDSDLKELSWSEELYRIYGLPLWSEITYDRFIGLVHESDRERIAGEFAAALSRGGRFTFDHRITRPDLSVRELHSQGRVVRGPSSRLPRMLGSSQDVTDRRQLEEQLRHAQKMEAIGRLAGGVAHDFNNLLTVIQSYGTFLSEELPKDSALHADLSEILAAADRAAALTQQLLAFSRRQILQPRLVRVNRNVTNVVGMLRRVIGEDIILDTDLSAEEWPVLADPSQLEQVLLNLAVNARDAMPTGGRLTIRTARVTLNATEARNRCDDLSGDFMSIVVEDTGVGMTHDLVERIFEPFFTTKAAGKGTGLGLATVYGIVNQSGGCVYVDSTPDVGSTFTILLPSSATTDTATPVTAPLPRGDETILLVEDERPVRAAVRRMLEALGYRVREAASGAEALGTLESTQERIHLVLTDIVMPDIQGRLLAEFVHERHAGHKVLYMSGYTEDEILRRELGESGTALLNKPFTAETLAIAVRRALDD